jgi:hypothetical protein
VQEGGGRGLAFLVKLPTTELTDDRGGVAEGVMALRSNEVLRSSFWPLEQATGWTMTGRWRVGNQRSTGVRPRRLRGTVDIAAIAVVPAAQMTTRRLRRHYYGRRPCVSTNYSHSIPPAGRVNDKHT